MIKLKVFFFIIVIFIISEQKVCRSIGDCKGRKGYGNAIAKDEKCRDRNRLYPLVNKEKCNNVEECIIIYYLLEESTKKEMDRILEENSNLTEEQVKILREQGYRESQSVIYSLIKECLYGRKEP